MKSRIWIGALVLCAVALAAWLAWGLRAEGGRGAVVSGTSVAPELSTSAASEAARSIEPAERIAAPGAATKPITSSEPDATTHVRVRVFDRASAAPVPGAEILWTEVEGSDVGRARDPAQVDGLLAMAGNRARADAEGLARVPWEREQTLLIAGRSGELWGSRLAAPSAGDELRLELVGDYAIDVLVLAPQGPAAGVPVALYREGASSHSVLVVARTDAEGRARLPHAGATLAALSEAQRSYFWIAAALPLAEPVRVPLNISAPPTEPVVLELPLTGSLEVVVRTLEGRPPPAGSVELARHLSDGERARESWAASFFGAGSSQAPDSAPLEGAVAHFPAVGLGLDLRATVSVQGAGVPTVKDFAGPTAAGQRQTVEVVLGSDHPVLRLRAVDEGLVALADVELVPRIVGLPSGGWGEPPPPQILRLRTAADGTFELHLEPRDEGRPERALILVLAADAEHSASEARVDLARAFPDGVSELGDVVLRPAPLLAAGRVVDGEGAPLAGASVFASTAGPGSSRSLGAPVRSDAEGRFELRATCDTPEARLTARAAGRSSAELHCTPGVTGLELVLEKSGSIAGTLRSDGVVPFTDLQVRATHISALPPDAENRVALRRSMAGRSANPRADGSFLLEGLAPGIHDLSVTLRGRLESLTTLSNLVVPPGGACDDPRLASIEVRGGPRRVRVHLVASEPGAQVRGSYSWRNAGEAGFRIDALGPGGIELEGQGPFDLRVQPFEHRWVRIDGVDSDRTVHLQRGLPVRLKLPEGLRPPAPPFVLRADVRDPLRDAPGLGLYMAPAFDEHGELELLAEAAGTLHLSLGLVHVTGHGEDLTRIGPSPQAILVLETGREQVFTADLTQDEIDQAVAKGR